MDRESDTTIDLVTRTVDQDSPSSCVMPVYEYIAVFVAILAIFSFCASTTNAFQIDDPNTPISSNISLAHNSSQQTSNGSILSTNDDDYEMPRSSRISPVLIIIDYVCLAFFTLEYLIRLLSAPKPWKFIISVTAVIDVLAILPDYIEFIVEAARPDLDNSVVLDFLFLLRLMRVIRIFRVVRRVPGLWIMICTLKASYRELGLMLLVLLMGTLLFASIIYFVDDTRIFTSIPTSFWWAIVTMTTVGYGDMVPVTPWGQLVGSFTAISGVLVVAFTIPSLVNNFTDFYNLIQYEAKQKRLERRKAAKCAGVAYSRESSSEGF